MCLYSYLNLKIDTFNISYLFLNPITLNYIFYTFLCNLNYFYAISINFITFYHVLPSPFSHNMLSTLVSTNPALLIKFLSHFISIFFNKLNYFLPLLISILCGIMLMGMHPLSSNFSLFHFRIIICLSKSHFYTCHPLFLYRKLISFYIPLFFTSFLISIQFYNCFHYFQ